MMLTVYVFSGGDTATNVLNAIATLTNGSSATFTTALSIAGVFAVCGGSIAYVRSHNILTWVYWFALYLGMMTIGLGIKTSVEVIDATNPMQVTTVDNIPIGIALPASEATSISYALTKAIDSIFHQPDDLSYSSTGMLFGSKQLVNSSQVTIQNAENRFLWNQYYRQCMVPDVVLNGKYTWMQLMETNNLIGFLDGIPQSTLRGIYDGSGKFLTCQQTYQQIKTALSNEVKAQTLPALAEKLFGGKNSAQAQARLSETLPGSYQYYTGLSASAESILAQNMLINATKNASQNYGAEVGATAGMENYSFSKQENTMLLANENSAAQAAYYLPMLQTVLFLLLCATFPLIVLLAIQPYFGVRIVLSYLGGFIYLGSWPIFYAILNYIMTVSLYWGTKGMASHGFTLNNADQLAYDHSQVAGIAGYLELAIPVLSLMIVRGMGSVMSQAAQYFFGMTHSIAGQLANEVASGNINLGNASIANQSWNNIAANKHDVNFTAMQGMGIRQTMHGTDVALTASGREIYRDNAGISQLPIGVMLQQQFSDSVQNAYQQQQSHLHQTQAQLAQTESAVMDSLSQFSMQQGKNDNYGHGTSLSTSGKTAEAVNQINRAVHDYVQSHGGTDQQALNHLMTARAEVHAAGNIGVSAPGTRTGAAAGVRLNVDGSTVSAHIRTSSNDSRTGCSHAIEQSFNHGVDMLYSEATSHHTEHSHSQSQSILGQLSANLHRAESLSATVSEMNSQSQSLQSLYQHAQQSSSQVTQNVIPAFVDYVKTHTSAPHAESLLSNPANVANTKELSQLANQFVTSTEGKQLMTSAVDQTVATHMSSSNAFSQKGYQQSAALLHSGEQRVNQSMTHDKGLVKSTEANSDMSYRGWKSILTEKGTEGFIHMDQQKLNHQHQGIEQTGNHITQQTQKAMRQIKGVVNSSFFRRLGDAGEFMYDITHGKENE